MPQLMAAAHVPEAKIVAITAIASIPGFTFFFFSPILEVRFSRRWYATVLVALSGTASAVAILSLHHLLVLQIVLVIAGTSGLSSFALGGWFSNITPNEHKNPLSKWINISIFAGTGLISAAGGAFVRRLPAILANLVSSWPILPSSTITIKAVAVNAFARDSV